MKINFPESNKVYLQNNRTNVFPAGNVWSTSNIDFQSNLGVLRISPRMRQTANSVNLPNFGVPVAFRWFDTKIIAICGTHTFYTDTGGLPDSAWIEDVSTNAQTDYSADESDMEVFNNTLCTTTTDALYSKAGNGSGTGAWTARDVLVAGSPHVVCYFRRYNRLYYSNNNDDIISINTDWSTADPGADYSITLSGGSSEEYVITCMRPTDSYIWIGTHIGYSNKAMPGKVCQWDGLSAQVTAEYELNNAQGVLALAIDPKYESPVVLDTNGVLSAFNGSGFEEVDRFPYPFVTLPWAADDRDNERAVHPNGMYFTKNGTLRILLNNRPAITGANVVENMPSGIWEYTKENGLVHVQSITYNDEGSATITDWGQNRVARVGALVSMNIYSTAAQDGTTLAGVQAYTNATDTINYIQLDDSQNTIQKKGYFVTDWFESDEIADSWDIWWMSYRRFLDATDNFTLKYRCIEEAPVEAAITWVNTTSFTVLNSAVDVSLYWTSGVGGEVEILRGVGGGLCAHITDAVNNAGTWTVTIDETATGATTTTATARFQKWIKVFPAESLATPKNWAQFAIGTNSEPRVQIKGCFTLTGNGEFYKGILTSNEDITKKQ